jgi:hypothetical protein
MSIWSDLLSLHGYFTRPHNDNAEVDPSAAARRAAESAERLREVIGCRSSSTHLPELRGPLLGVRGLT